MLGFSRNLGLSVVLLVAASGCGGGVDAVADGEEAGSGGGDPTSSGSPAGTGGETSSLAAPTGSGNPSGAGGATGGATTGTGGSVGFDCAPDDDGTEVVGCGFAPDLALIGVDGTAAYAVTAATGGTARVYRVDLATGARTELYHDTFSGWDAANRARHHLLLDGEVYAVLNRIVGGGVDTGVFRLDGGDALTSVVPFGVTQYTHLVGARGEIFYLGDQATGGLFSVRVEDGARTTWTPQGGELIGASYDGEPESVAVYTANGELYRIPNTTDGYGEIDDAVVRDAALAPRAADGSYLGGEVYLPFDGGFAGTHRIDVIAPGDGARTTLAEVPDVEGFGPPRFLHVRVVGASAEVFYVQTNDRSGGIARIDAETGEPRSLAGGFAYGDGPITTAGNHVYFTRTRGGDDGPVEGVILRTRLD